MSRPTTRLRLRVSTKAALPGISGRLGDAWKVRVSVARERGKANAAVLELLADVLEVPPSGIELVAGRTSRDKVVEVAGLTGSQVESRLRRAAVTLSARGAGS